MSQAFKNNTRLCSKFHVTLLFWRQNDRLPFLPVHFLSLLALVASYSSFLQYTCPLHAHSFVSVRQNSRMFCFSFISSSVCLCSRTFFSFLLCTHGFICTHSCYELLIKSWCQMHSEKLSIPALCCLISLLI